MSDHAQSRVGTTVRGKWRIDKLLGTGGMGAVYAATHRNGSRVALKILHPQLSMLGEVRARFAREGYVANSVQHPGVCRVLDDDVTEDGAAFLVMELLEGETAESRARRLGGRLPLVDVVALGEGLLDVLVAAHAAQVVHRDVKPDNVFLTRDGEVKVLDFGIARLREATDGGRDEHAPLDLRTRTGITLGTPAFMPPEQALGRTSEIDALTDVWAVGATLFALASGRIVHDARSHMEVVIAAATAQARSLGSVAPDVPSGLVEIVDRALSFRKEDRWPSARAMQTALRTAFTASRPPPSSLVGSVVPTAGAPASLTPSTSAASVAPSAASAPPTWAEERKLATVLHAELVGFADLAATLEPDATRELANAFFEPLSREVEREGGTVMKFLGDGMVAVFGVPIAHEDDPERAVRAALALRERVVEVARARAREVELRVGVQTGLVMVGVVGTGSRASVDVMGATVNLAARTADAAAPGEVLVASSTERFVGSHFELAERPSFVVRGLADPVRVFAVVRERDEARPSSARIRSASAASFVARGRELERLVALYETVVASRALRVAEVTGEVGLGKGHLLKCLREAFAARAEPPRVIHALRPQGTAPFAFLGKLLRSHFGVRADDAPDEVRERVESAVARIWGEDADVGREAGRVLADLVAPTPAAPLLETELPTDRAKTAAVFADWIRHLASEGPVVVMAEQVSFADAASRDALEYLVRALRGEPVFLVVSTRTDQDEQVPPWLTGAELRARIELTPLDDDTMHRFVDELFAGVTAVPREVRDEIVRRAEGNPELCKQLVRLLVDRGALAVDGEGVPVRWNPQRSARLELPDTVRGVLQARLDGLPPMHKELLKVASVVGRTFWLGALRELLPGVSDDVLVTSLDALRARDMVRVGKQSSLSGEREWTMASQVLCDAAYALVPRREAVSAHRKVAEWLSARGELWEGGAALLAQHLDQAGEPGRARRLYLQAARHAANLSAYQDAMPLFDRALELWADETSPDERLARAAVLREAAQVATRVGRFDDALALLERAEHDLHEGGVDADDPVFGWIGLERGLIHREYGRAEATLEVLGATLERVKRLMPGVLHMRLRSARAFLRATSGDAAGAREDCDEGLRIGRSLHVRDASWHAAMARLEDARGAVSFLGGDLATAADAFGRALALRETAGDGLGMQDSYANLGAVAYQRGDFDEAARIFERGLASAKRMHWVRCEALGHSNLGQAELKRAHLDRALHELQRACRLADEGRYLDIVADATRAVAECHLARRDLDDAITAAEEAIERAVEAKSPSFEGLAHGVAMDAWLEQLGATGDPAAASAARRHKDAGVACLQGLGRTGDADALERRFSEGRNATLGA